MQGAGWIELIRRIPVKYHDVLSFATVSGSEIMAQNIVRLEEDFVVLRGRLAGSQEAGRIMILPYDQIVNLALNKQLKEKDVTAIFGATLSSAAAAPARSAESEAEMEAPEEGEDVAAGAEEAPDAAETPEEEAQRAQAGVALSTAAHSAEAKEPAPPNPAQKPPPVSKSLLLARLRQRLAEQNK
jgi:hypothetical protein